MTEESQTTHSRLSILTESLRWLETVSSTFQDLEFDGSLQPLYTC